MNELILDKDKKYLVAVSFGPDSMALLDMLYQGHFNIIVAHVNYGLRKEAKEETDELVKYCKEKDIPLEVLYVNYTPNQGNIEDFCRRVRYQYFAKVSQQYNCFATLVAHHEDDLIETYLLQLRRHNLPLYYGLEEEVVICNNLIIRPLLSYTKKELLDYCKDNFVPFEIDSSNEENTYLRNQIRHEIVEKMTIDERRKIKEEILTKNEELKKLLDSLNSLSFDIKTLLTLDDISLAYFLNLELKKVCPSSILSKGNINEIKKAIVSKKPNICVIINENLIFIKEYDEIEFAYPYPQKDYSFTLDSPSVLETDYFYLDFTKDTSDRNVFLDDYPLTIRNARGNDKYKINNYYSTVNRLFIDWKIPLRLRKIWPVILNKNNQIIYIPRYRKDFTIDSALNFYVKKSY